MSNHRLIKETAIILAVISFGSAALHHPATAHASSVFTKTDVKGPTGYFKSAKAGFAFHWKNVKTSSGTARVIVMGDFKAPQVAVMMPTKNTITNNRTKFTANFRTVSSTGKVGSKNYKLYLYKKSSTKYTAKLTGYRDGRAVSTKGTTYTFTRTTKNPATSYASAYTKPIVTKLFTTAANTEAKSQNEDITNASYKAALKKAAASYATKTAKQVVTAFNVN